MYTDESDLRIINRLLHRNELLRTLNERYSSDPNVPPGEFVSADRDELYHRGYWIYFQPQGVELDIVNQDVLFVQISLWFNDKNKCILVYGDSTHAGLPARDVYGFIFETISIDTPYHMRQFVMDYLIEGKRRQGGFPYQPQALWQQQPGYSPMYWRELFNKSSPPRY